MDALTELVTKDSPTECHAELSQAKDFVTTVQKKDSNARNFPDQIKRLHKAVLKGSVADVKSCLKYIPAEALFLIDGLEADIKVNPFPNQTDDISIDLKSMTMLEVACCLKHRKLLDYLVKDLCIRHDRDFVKERHAKDVN